MNKRVALPLVAVAAVFTLVGGAAVASADHRDSGARTGFIDRMAEILGLAPEEVSSAMSQAHDEARAERMATNLAEAVEANVITQDESDAISDWFGGRPEALKSMRHHGLRSAVQAGEVEAFLADLVGQELITQVESDEISDWLAIRPASIDSFREWRMEQFNAEGHRDHRGHQSSGRGGHGRFGFHNHGGGESVVPGVVSDPV